MCLAQITGVPRRIDTCLSHEGLTLWREAGSESRPEARARFDKRPPAGP